MLSFTRADCNRLFPRYADQPLMCLNGGSTHKSVCFVRNRRSHTQIMPKNPFSTKGDSGGPLVSRLSNGRYQLLGVASFVSNRCANPSYSGYAIIDRTAILNWIKNNAGGECK